ncbi:MAG: divalent-cation tolerance protein CutA [Candidatus Omnitrophica bacterium]|nr:divalent-cation tolerance protein CutA [Candidatus Omnitrophota bacterium]
MYIVVFSTVPNKKEAELIAQGLIKDKLAACVNIIENVYSLFWWQGKIDSAKEVLLVIKTRKALAAKLTKKIKSLHSYEVPEIIALPIVSGNKEYLEWINESTR